MTEITYRGRFPFCDSHTLHVSFGVSSILWSLTLFGLIYLLLKSAPGVIEQGVVDIYSGCKEHLEFMKARGMIIAY